MIISPSEGRMPQHPASGCENVRLPGLHGCSAPQTGSAICGDRMLLSKNMLLLVVYADVFSQLNLD